MQTKHYPGLAAYIYPYLPHLPMVTNHLLQNHLFEYGLTSSWLIFGLNIDDIWSYQWSYLGEYAELDISAANLGAVNL